MSDLVGRTLGQYEIVAELGHGGMANVYRAVQASIGREVAIKQRDYGIEPVRIAAGAVRIKDEVKVEFDIVR